MMTWNHRAGASCRSGRNDDDGGVGGDDDGDNIRRRAPGGGGGGGRSGGEESEGGDGNNGNEGEGVSMGIDNVVVTDGEDGDERRSGWGGRSGRGAEYRQLAHNVGADVGADDDDGVDGIFDVDGGSFRRPRRCGKMSGGRAIIALLAISALLLIFDDALVRRSKSGDACEKNGDDAPLSASYSEGFANGAVASDHPVCSALGVDVMRRMGGNAVDAAVAVALCLGVANPASSGIGGGAFLLLHVNDEGRDEGDDERRSGGPLFHDGRDRMMDTGVGKKVTEVIDCREVAPAAARTNMYIADESVDESGGGDDGDKEGQRPPPPSSTLGGSAIAVPGELRGLELAHYRYGSLPWSDVVKPAADLARDGVKVNANLEREIRALVDLVEQQTNREQGGGGEQPDEDPVYVEYGLRKLLTKSDDWDDPLKEGDVLRNPALSETLLAVMEGGSDALYEGELADGLARDIRDAGGIMTASDISRYVPTIRSPLIGVIPADGGGGDNRVGGGGFSVAGVPPPSSGGASVIGALRLLSYYNEPASAFQDTLTVHRISEACKHAFAIRMSLCDPSPSSSWSRPGDQDDGDGHGHGDDGEIAATISSTCNGTGVRDAVRDLVSGGYMRRLYENTLDDSTLPLSQYGGENWSQLNDGDGHDADATDIGQGDRRRVRGHGGDDGGGHGDGDDFGVGTTRRKLARPFGYLNDHGTSHFSVVDSDGNAVAMTTSVNTYFGSKVVSPSTGIVLNNQMDDFATPGKANAYGLKPSPGNYIQPDKRPLSSMSPTMIFRRPRDGGTASGNGEGEGAAASSGDDLGDLALVVGASGGPKIITAVLQVAVHHVLMGKPLDEAVSHPRIHDQLLYHGAAVTGAEDFALRPGGPQIRVPPRTRDALIRRGHDIVDLDFSSAVQGVAVDPETKRLSAACDIRKGGSPAGY